MPILDTHSGGPSSIRVEVVLADLSAVPGDASVGGHRDHHGVEREVRVHSRDAVDDGRAM